MRKLGQLKSSGCDDLSGFLLVYASSRSVHRLTRVCLFDQVAWFIFPGPRYTRVTARHGNLQLTCSHNLQLTAIPKNYRAMTVNRGC
jgi:hypothetical protein